MAQNEALESASDGGPAVARARSRSADAWRLRVAGGLLLALVVGVAALRFEALDRTLPYARHMDELFLSKSAHSILQTGDWNPHFFRYPSLPIYLTTAGLAAGSLREAASERAFDVSDLQLTQRGRPYRPLRPMRAARQLFVCVGLAGLVFTGILAYRLTDRAALLWLAPLVLATSAGLARSGWEYLNVDVLATTLSAATLAFLVAHWHDDSAFARSIGPGLLVGLTVASKYTAGVLAVSCLLAIWLAPGRRRVRRALLFGVVAAVAFLACVPFALLDARSFIDDVVYEVRHYALGHEGHEGPAGWPQLLYYLGRLQGEFGALNLAAAGLGLGGLLRRRPRETLVVASFGASLLFLMSLQRVHFLRNLFPLQVGLAVFCAFGWWLAYERLATFASRRIPGLPFVRALAAALLLTVSVWSLPLEAIRWANLPRTDSRNRLADWLRRESPGATLLLPQRLPFAAGDGLRVERYPLTRAGLAAGFARTEDAVLALPRLPAGVELPGGEAVTRQWRAAVHDLIEREDRRPVRSFEGAAFEVREASRPLNPGLDLYRVGAAARGDAG